MKVVLKHAGKWLHFQCPEKVLRAESVGEVVPLLRETEESGLFVAGFVSYEAAPAFDSALATNSTTLPKKKLRSWKEENENCTKHN